jgi:hypothetical protein
MSALYLVFSGTGGGLFNVNNFRAHGRGAASEDSSSSSRGLLAEYFNNTELQGDPDFTRIEPGAGFNWGRRSPADGIRIDFFSVRWSGSVRPPTSGTYRFFADTDNLVRVLLDGAAIIDRWDSPVDGEAGSRSVRLEAGRSYDLVVEYAEQTGDARIIVRWESGGLPRQVIDAEILSPERTTVSSAETFDLPKEFALRDLFPNPFRSKLTVAFDAPSAQRVRFELFDMTGRRVLRLMDREVAAGRHRVSLDVRDLASGLYSLRMTAAGWNASTRIVHIR